MSNAGRGDEFPTVAPDPIAHTLGRRRRSSTTRTPRRRRRSAVPPVLAFPERGTLIGLSDELGLLRDLWDEACAGTVQLAFIGGEPGAGKSRLASEVAQIANGEDAQVLFGYCRAGNPAPYAALRDALTRPSEELNDEWLLDHGRRHGPALARLVPDVGRRVPALARMRETATSPIRVITALEAVLAELGGRAPVLLVLEDLQWASRSTVRVLEHLVRYGPAMPLLVLATYQDRTIDPSHPLSAMLETARPDTMPSRVVIDGLSQREVCSFIVDRLSIAGSAAARLGSTLWHVTEGNPLFLVEALRDLVEEGVIIGGQVQGAALAEASMPRDLAELVVRRLNRQDDLVREVVEAASVCGTEFSLSLLRETVVAKPEAMEAALERAVAAGLMRPATAEGRWRFAHAVFEQAVYASIPPSRQVRLHERVAETLERDPGPDPASPALLAHHFVASAPVGGSEKALRHAIRAAEEASAVLAFDEAADHYGQALSMLGGATGAHAVRADLLLHLGEAYHLAGEQARARQAFLQAAFGARASGDGPRLARATLALGSLDLVWGADGELIGLIDRALEITRDDSALQAQLLGRLAQARAVLDSPDERKARSDRAWELAWDSRDPATMGSVLLARHQALSAPDDLEDRIEAAGELLAMAAASGNDELAVRAHGWRFVDLMEQVRLGDADRDLTAHGKLARRSGDPRHRRDAAAWGAARAMLAGNPGRATTLADRAQALGEQAGDADGPSIYWAQQWGLLVDWGDEAEIDELIPVWRDLVRSHDNDPSWQARFSLLLAIVGRKAEAAVILEDLTDQGCANVAANRSWISTLSVLAEVANLVGAATEAGLLCRLLGPHARRLVVFEGGWLMRGAVARAAGLAALAAGRWTDAERHFENALGIHDGLPLGPATARTHYEWGHALLHRGEPGDRIRAHDLLDTAATEADHLGMPWLAARARSAEASAGH